VLAEPGGGGAKQRAGGVVVSGQARGGAKQVQSLGIARRRGGRPNQLTQEVALLRPVGRHRGGEVFQDGRAAGEGRGVSLDVQEERVIGGRANAVGGEQDVVRFLAAEVGPVTAGCGSREGPEGELGVSGCGRLRGGLH
jgi:hypothetical protein